MGLGRRRESQGLVGIGGNVFEEGPRVVLPLGILDVVLPRPEDERTICNVLLNREKPFFGILEV